MAGMSRFLLLTSITLSSLACGARTPYEGKSVAQLTRMLQDTDPKVQAQGAFGLSLLGAAAKPAVPGLVEQLKNPDSLVRQQSALALGHIGPDASDAVQHLTDALRD